MKKLSIVLAAAVLIATACNTGAGSKNGPITINMKNIPAQEVRLMVWDGGNTNPVAIDTVQYAGGDKPLLLEAGPLTEQSYLVVEFAKDVKNGKYIPLISSGEAISITGDYQKIQEVDVKGSAATTEMLGFFKKVSEKNNSIGKIQAALDSMAAIKKPDSNMLATEKMMVEQINQLLNDKKDFIATTKNPVNAIIGFQTIMNREELKMLKPQMDSALLRFPASSFVKKAHATYTAYIADKPAAPQADATATANGTPAKEITLPDVNGKTVTLSSFRGKYVLIDFWASWCGPCRQENPNVVAAFNKFKNKNFTILGVSLDREKGAWLEAIKADGLAWTQLSELKFWDTKPVQDYGVRGIPANFLVDPTGNIIASDLRGPALEQKLAEVLK